MPARQIASAGSPAMSAPSKRIAPAFGRSVPAIRLNVVLLPEPFGPINPRISPWRASKDIWLTARNPPNRFDRPSTASIFSASSLRAKRSNLAPLAHAFADRDCFVGLRPPRNDGMDHAHALA